MARRATLRSAPVSEYASAPVTARCSGQRTRWRASLGLEQPSSGARPASRVSTAVHLASAAIGIAKTGTAFVVFVGNSGECTDRRAEGPLGGGFELLVPAG